MPKNSSLNKALSIKVFIKLFTAIYSAGNIGNESKLLNEWFEKTEAKESFLDLLDHALVKLKKGEISEPEDEELKLLATELNGLKKAQIQILKKFIKKNRQSNKKENVEDKKAFIFICLCKGLFLPESMGGLSTFILKKMSIESGNEIWIKKNQKVLFSFLGYLHEIHWKISDEIVKDLVVKNFRVHGNRKSNAKDGVPDGEYVGKLIGRGSSKRIPLKQLFKKMIVYIDQRDRDTADTLFKELFKSHLEPNKSKA